MSRFMRPETWARHPNPWSGRTPGDLSLALCASLGRQEAEQCLLRAEAAVYRAAQG
jgi:hypothetical protein